MNNQDNFTQGKITTGPPLGTPIFFSVSPFKLIVMSVCTFGFYDLYWFYKNWNVIKKWDRPYIRPFWRAFFAYFFCFGVFQLIRKHADSQSIHSSYSPIALTIGWIVLSLLTSLPVPFSWISYLAVLFILPAQQTVNSMNHSLVPDQNKNENFTVWNIVVVIVGGIVSLAMISEPLWIVE